MMAQKAQMGDAEALWGIKAHFQPHIHRLSEISRNQISSQCDFEEDCFKRIDEAVKIFDIEKGRFRALVEAKLRERLNRWKKRNITKTRNFTSVPIISKDGECSIDVKDDRAIIEDNILVNEEIASLAGGDLRNLAILKSWTYTGNSDTATATLLAQSYGGNAESHRRYITRFKSQCQTTLLSAV